MRYTYNKDIELLIKPSEFNKDSGKEILQYAIGGLLYMPASNTNIVKKVISREYDYVKSIVLDLEDALGDDMIQYGKKSILGIMRELGKGIEEGRISINEIPLIFIRIRELGDMKKLVEELGKDIKLLTGFNIPKFDKTNCDRYVEEFREISEVVLNEVGTTLYIMPIIESKQVMYRQLRMENLLYISNAIKPISDKVLNIRVGGADMCNIIGVRRGINNSIYEIGAVADCLNDIVNMFGRSYIVSGPMWEYFKINENNNWLEGLRQEIKEDRNNGFIGKTCIHPSQVPVVQELSIVNKGDYMDAIDILGMNENIIGVQKSIINGRMNEVKTHNYWAKKVIGMARVFGVRGDN